MTRSLCSLALLASALAAASASVAFAASGASTAELPRRTAIDDYVQAPDDSYSWEIVSTKKQPDEGITTVVVNMVSQTWLTADDVDRTEWRHWLTLIIPSQIVADVPLLYIGGGSNGGDAPTDSNARMAALAKATGTVVAELGMVPNQPLVFHDDGKPRYEDDLIGYAWQQFLQTGEARWLPRNAMVKSAARAMDTVTAVMASDVGGKRRMDRFVVAGGSKRGWTTWLVGAMDERVVGIAPIVIDVLNVLPSMRHHFAAYGFWAPSIGDYVAHGIMRRFDDPRLAELYRLVDPYFYRHRLAMPKLLLNATGDQFFLPDSSAFYWDDLRGESYLRYVPNGDHGLGGTDAMETVIAFHSLLASGAALPRFSWRRAKDGALRVLATDEPEEVRLWQATNPQARDFRIETLGPAFASTVVEAKAEGLYEARVAAPTAGWTAWFLELAYDVGAATPLKLTTDVAVTPDTLPFADKPPDLPASATLICRAADVPLAELAQVARTMEPTARQGEVATQIVADALYVNWTPAVDIRASAVAVADLLRESGCQDLLAQLESGPGATLPPAVSAR